MRIKEILPSERFATIVGSVALAALLVWGAYALTHPAPHQAQLASSDTPAPAAGDWRQSLEEIQAQNPLNKAPQGPSADTVNKFLNAAQSNNLTDTVARTLLVNLSEAKGQGLGDDTPTQDQLVAQALAQVKAQPAKKVYASSDLTLSSSSADALKAYGNAFIAAVGKHQAANYNSVVYIVGTSTDNGDPTKLAALAPIADDYASLAKDLAKVPVPPTLAPIHLQIINNMERMSESLKDVQNLYNDSLKGLANFELYDALTQETLRLFINLAQGFSQNGILFSKGDPGEAWSALVP